MSSLLELASQDYSLNNKPRVLKQEELAIEEMCELIAIGFGQDNLEESGKGENTDQKTAYLKLISGEYKELTRAIQRFEKINKGDRKYEHFRALQEEAKNLVDLKNRNGLEKKDEDRLVEIKQQLKKIILEIQVLVNSQDHPFSITGLSEQRERVFLDKLLKDLR